ncbi:uncharacterized protein LOC117110738 isoform X2 [Anneissia japonica]|uniref:uncharacterized protein LOC117110738 isoform X1 n=1 Tax=Anneissia japonica TaxID=1529436 RepID=UPI00142588CD|nr:uncharacterized protein LOC117110738 isoform X1 [Anneissia japonica]XP_033109416.1 uncharacterized protein LOC117110738 isoform X1 [Anneissia japonica]XP_033109417.1 uncharacterized protein LOC117110738 isoform X2 [Anneissia japonica]
MLSTTGIFFSTNDCYLGTMDADFCSSRPTETQYVGTVYDLRIDSIYPNVTNSNELLANVSWLPPLQINPQYALIGYHGNYIDAEESTNVILGSVLHNNNSRKEVRYSVLLEGLQKDKSYTLKIAAFVTKEGDITVMGKPAAITIETPESVNIPTTVIHGGTREIMTEPTHLQKTSTLQFSKAPNTKSPPQSSSNGGWMDENQTVVVAVIICASLLVVGSLAFACYIAQVKEEKVDHRHKMISVRKIGNEYIYN